MELKDVADQLVPYAREHKGYTFLLVNATDYETQFSIDVNHRNKQVVVTLPRRDEGWEVPSGIP